MKNFLDSFKSRKITGKKGVILGGSASLEKFDFNSEDFKKREDIKSHCANVTEIIEIGNRNNVFKNNDPLNVDQIIDKSNEGKYKCPFCTQKDELTQIKEHIKKCCAVAIVNEPKYSISAMITANEFFPLKNGLEIFKKYLNNLIYNPTDPKFKKIRANNNVFINNIKPLIFHENVLDFCGFKPFNETELIYINENLDIAHLNYCNSQLEMSNLIYPILCRNMKKYRIKNIENVQDNEKDLEITTNDIQAEIRRKREENAEKMVLKSRTTKADESNKVVIIKIKILDSSILEGNFFTDEKIFDIYSFVLMNLTAPNSDFVLQMTSSAVGNYGEGSMKNKLILCDDETIGGCGIRTNTTIHLRNIGIGQNNHVLNDFSDEIFSNMNKFSF